MIKSKTVYTTEDGFEFDSMEKAQYHQNLCELWKYTQDKYECYSEVKLEFDDFVDVIETALIKLKF